MFGGRNANYEGNKKMNTKLICASLLVAGMATSAFAQSSTGAGTTMEPNAVGTDGGANVQTMQPMASDPTSTGSTMNGSTTMVALIGGLWVRNRKSTRRTEPFP